MLCLLTADGCVTGWENDKMPSCGLSCGGGIISVKLGFSGSNFDCRCGFCGGTFVSGEIARPIVSGMMLLLENMLGFEISSRGGTFGGTLPAILVGVPSGPLSTGPLKPTNLPLLLPEVPVEGSIWNGSMSLSRAFRCFLLLQHANIAIQPSATAPPPMEATVIPII